MSAALLLLTMVSSFVFIIPALGQPSKEFTNSSIVNADLEIATEEIQKAFNAILNAENSGANVTALLNQLNQATYLLMQAEIANITGNFDAAESNVANAISMAQMISADAQHQKNIVASSNQTAKVYTVIICTVACAVFVAVVALYWRRFKANYIRNLYGAKPEVADNEA